jgi:hypothetical protein
LLVGVSGKSLFYFVLLDGPDLVFVPCFIAPATSLCPYNPPNYPINKLLLQDDFVYMHAKCIVFKTPADIDVGTEWLAIKELKRQARLKRNVNLHVSYSVRLPDKVPGSKLVYKNKMNPPIDFGVSPNGVHLITLLTDFKVNITDMETEELLTIVFKFVGLQLIVPACFEFPGFPTLVSTNSR